MMADDRNISGGKALDDFLKSLPVKVERNILRSALRQGANVFKVEVRENIPVDSGELRRSVRVVTKAKGGKVTASVRVGNKRAWYGHMVEFGTKPHKIVPKKKGALVIGQTRAMVVDHPGAKPHPYMRPAFDTKPTAAIAAVGMQIRKRLTAEGINVPAAETD